VDCGREPPVAPSPPRSYAGVDLMAHDYDSLLRAMLDLLPQLAPEWLDRSEADLGIVLMELLAYAGDQLSYLQDRVALEGFLRTATQRESVRKLVRMIDYTMDPGRSAETMVLFEVDGLQPFLLPAGFQIASAQLKGIDGGDDPAIYETSAEAIVRPAISRMALASDAPSSADRLQIRIAADLTGQIAIGDRLFIQQADTAVPNTDLSRLPDGEWCEVAAAPVVAAGVTTLTVAAPLAANYSRLGDPVGGIAPARVYGNAVRATHGATQVESFVADGTANRALALELAPISQVPEANTADADSEPAVEQALEVRVDGVDWYEVEDFIDSEPADRHYRITRSNDGYVTVHFGDGARGAVPPKGAKIVAEYRVGLGAAGQVAPGALQRFDTGYPFPLPSQKILRVRNPQAATGARDPETMENAKLIAPYRLRKIDRAVTPDDYSVCLAEGVIANGRRYTPLQSKARMLHTGSWNTVYVSVDMPDRRPLRQTPAVRAAFEALLAEKKMAGVDARVEDARYCPLHIALKVEVSPGHFARDVRSAVERALVGTPAAGGAADPAAAANLPFFAAGRFGFGQAVYLSDLYAVVAAIDGVESVAVTRFKRLGDRYPDNEIDGMIPVGALEVARCDNDASATEHGVLYVRTLGGKEG
jgi:hypothetical protein